MRIGADCPDSEIDAIVNGSIAGLRPEFTRRGPEGENDYYQIPGTQQYAVVDPLKRLIITVRPLSMSKRIELIESGA